MKNGNEKLPTYDQVSAGGVAYRRVGDGVEIAMILTKPERRWQLPKGMIDDGETEEEAASREVREEAGINTQLISKIDRTEYWFTAEREGIRSRFHKRVHWFVMLYVSGDVADHDHEVFEARWTPADQALGLLAFKNERDVVSKALKIIEAAS